MKPLALLASAVIASVVAPLRADPAVDATQFTLEFGGSRIVRRAALREIPASTPGGPRFAAADGSFTVAVSRTDTTADGVSYSRTFVTVANTARSELPLTRITLVDTPAPAEARAAGTYVGSPVVTAGSFLGIEHPLADNRIVDGRLVCALPVMQPLRPGETATASFVFGTAAEPSQLRRAFLAYLERERPRPYAPFLHHNTWYNLGFGKPFSEADELGLIATVGRELVERRHVRLDAFVLDDGWDDTHSLWRFHAGWPDGLKAMAAAAGRFGAATGIWLSPWGGYMEAKQQRLAAAAPEGFEIRNGSFSLAGERYYARFRDLCAGVVKEGNVAYFKFDGIGAKSTGLIDPAAARDFDAMLRLVAELRRLRPGLYVSQTTGTWASPWWLLHVDNIWRGGRDHEFAGVGTERQRWLTYRDAQTHENVVRRSPLFPLNSVMIHGIIYSKLARHLATDPGDDLRAEVRSYFGSGTQLQELYLSPELLTAANWDDLAASANWARANADVLRDAHWIGGDPGRLEVYGWAAWSPRKGILTLRNPSDRPARFTLDANMAFQLPRGAPASYRVTGAYADAPAPVPRLRAGAPVEITLRPFEVLVIEATPATP